jgi:hypothetical protein
MFVVEFIDPEYGSEVMIFDRAEDANGAFQTLSACRESGCTVSTWEM